MAISKTLTPTNVTIQIPEFTDQPDQRVNSNCIDKEADAINALYGQIGNIGTVTLNSITTFPAQNGNYCPITLNKGKYIIVAHMFGYSSTANVRLAVSITNSAVLKTTSRVIDGKTRTDYFSATECNFATITSDNTVIELGFYMESSLSVSSFEASLMAIRVA